MITRSYDYVIVGAGFAGAVLAERLATQLGKRSLVVERRNHIGGNAHDGIDASGVLIHNYGPHYFRTNSDRILAYLSQFTQWHEVEYKILSWTHGRLWNFPINLNTFEQFIGKAATSEEMQAALERWKVPIQNPTNSEEVIISQVGWELYEMFFRGYTKKQWRREPKDLDPSICGRIPVRTNRDDRYLSDRFQALPKNGYTAVFERMLDHPLIDVQLNTDYRDVMATTSCGHMIYTGALDEYFDCRFGPLPYRSLRFETETLEQEYYQAAMQVNYPNDHDYTRIVEIKHATGQVCPRTTIVREYPQDYVPGSEPYYPVLDPTAKEMRDRYWELAEAEQKVSFVGRLATFRYLNMDQVVGMALAEFERLRSKLNA
jgi:UDP-galactopyranose mutase